MQADISDELLGHSGSYVDDRIVVTPPCFSKEIRFGRNRVRQMLLPSGYARVDMSTSTPCLVRSDGSIIRLIAGTSGLQTNERALRIGREGLRDPVAAIIYSFPLRQAQKHNYFSKINYVSVVDFENPDRAIADRAIKRLRDDLAAGFDHLLMA